MSFGDFGLPSDLLPAQMQFRTFRKQVVGPGFFLHCHLCSGRRSSFWPRCYRIILPRNIPIFRRIRDAPYIPVRVQRSPNQKMFPVTSQRQAVRHAGRDAATARQIVHHDRRLYLQSARTAKSTSLRTDYQHHTLLRKRTHPVETRHTNWNFHPQPCAAPRRLRSVHIYHELPAFYSSVAIRRTLNIVADSGFHEMVTKVTTREEREFPGVMEMCGAGGPAATNARTDENWKALRRQV